MRDPLDRRSLLWLGCTSAVVAALPGCAKTEERKPAPAAAPPPPVAVDSTVVRVASVPTAVEGDLLPTLVAEFERQSHLRVSLTATEGVYDMARDGKVDVAISHYGHKHAEAFVMDGF